MLKSSFLLSCFCLLGWTLSAQAPPKDFLQAYPQAARQSMNTYKLYGKAMDSIWVKTYHLDKAFLFAMVAPEVSQFGTVSETLQTSVVEALYTQFGASYANFSIGYFQMKPTFIEELEAYVLANPKTFKAYLAISNYGQLTSDTDIRGERIKRLKNIRWQMHYLATCYSILSSRFESKLFKTNTEKLRFFATAYNLGFKESSERIKSWESVKHFPSKTAKYRYSYAEVAEMFYAKFRN